MANIGGINPSELIKQSGSSLITHDENISKAPSSSVTVGMNMINSHTDQLDYLLGELETSLKSVRKDSPQDTEKSSDTYPVESSLGSNLRDLATNLENQVSRLRRLVYSIDL